MCVCFAFETRENPDQLLDIALGTLGAETSSLTYVCM